MAKTAIFFVHVYIYVRDAIESLWCGPIYNHLQGYPHHGFNLVTNLTVLNSFLSFFNAALERLLKGRKLHGDTTRYTKQ